MELGLKLNGKHRGVESTELYINPAYLNINILSPSKRITVKGVEAVDAIEEELDENDIVIVAAAKAIAFVQEEFVIEYPCTLNANIHANQNESETIEGKGTSLSGAMATKEEAEIIGQIMQNIAARTEKLKDAVKL